VAFRILQGFQSRMKLEWPFGLDKAPEIESRKHLGTGLEISCIALEILIGFWSLRVVAAKGQSKFSSKSVE